MGNWGTGEAEGSWSFGPRGRWGLAGADTGPGIFTGSPSSPSAFMLFASAPSQHFNSLPTCNPLEIETMGVAGNEEAEGMKGRLGLRRIETDLLAKRAEVVAEEDKEIYLSIQAAGHAYLELSLTDLMSSSYTSSAISLLKSLSMPSLTSGLALFNLCRNLSCHSLTLCSDFLWS